jgi:glycosyltransferase involved in cell wall biosynthesis
MVVRNEANNYLPQVLERLSKQVDLICVTDDCSDDNTAELAASYGARVNVMPEPTFSTHEGRLRQASWEFLESQIDDDDWFVLAIDADEELYETRYSIRDIVDQSQFDVVNIEFFHMWNDTQFRVDKAWRPHRSMRMFRYYTDGVFAQRQLACGSEPTYVQPLLRSGKYLPNSGLCMKHLSYIKDEDKKVKFDRYMKIDGGAFHANDHILSIMDEEPVLIDWRLG